MADPGRKTIWYAVAAVVVVVGILAAIGMATDDGGGGDNGGTSTGELTAAATDAGCLPVEEEKLPDKKNAPKHVAGEVDYEVEPPTLGDHSPNTLRNAKRFYSREDAPRVEQAVHNLEHGLVVAWYDDELPDDQVKILAEASQGMGARYVAVPWSRSTFEGDRHFVLTAWGVRQRCERVSVEHITEFIDDHADTKAPEKGYSV